MLGLKLGFCDLENLPRRLSKHKNFDSVHIESQIIGYRLPLQIFETSRIDLASSLREQQELNE